MPNQPPLVWLALLVVAGIFGAIATVGPYVWYLVVRRLRLGQSILEHEPRRLACWGLIDLVLIVVLMFFVFATLAIAAQTAGANLFSASGGDENRGRLYLMLIDSLAKLAATGMVGGFILLRTGCSLRDLGFSSGELARDLRLGFAAFCALAIPTFVLQGILTQFWPSEHPLIESLKVDRDPQFLVIAMFAAVIAAPLTEEFAFRVLFQGWLEKMFDPKAIFGPSFVGRLFAGESVRPPPPIMPLPDIVQAELASPNEPRSIYLGPPPLYEQQTYNPYQPPVTPPPPDVEAFSVGFPHWITDVIPITVCAGLFAVMHLSHGPDFIPLFVLALGLGYLYRRTHRIMPGLVVHFLLNLTSMLALCASIYGEGIPS
jgi:membrane protease YdiL (CAAX protease family)